jgi:plastocyanin
MRTLKAILLVAALVLIARPGPGMAQQGPMTWNVLIGAETPDHAVQLEDYFPRTITINAGDTITWTKPTLQPHTVHFLSGGAAPAIGLPQQDGRLMFNPLVRNPQGGSTYDGTGLAASGWLVEEKGLRYSLTFTKPGTYSYLCMLHPGMSGAVVVLDRGEKVLLTQAEYDAATARQIAEALSLGKQLLASGTPSVRKTARGTEYGILLKSASSAHVNFLRFAPDTITVKVGDTVRWETRDKFDPHTVTFAGTEQVPPWELFETQPQGPPRVFRNAKAALPSGGALHEGDGFYGSGRLSPLGTPGPLTYSLTFTKPGTYTYWCAIHVPEGMRGTIIVQ